MRLNGIVMHKALLLSQGAGRPGKRVAGRAGGFPPHRKRLCKSANCIFLGEEGREWGGGGCYLFFLFLLQIWGGEGLKKKKKALQQPRRPKGDRERKRGRGDLIEKSDSQTSCKCNYFLRK